jgi:hypothetical protein
MPLICGFVKPCDQQPRLFLARNRFSTDDIRPFQWRFLADDEQTGSWTASGD